MRYGILFAICGLLLAVLAIAQGGWWWLLLWPAVSFFLVGLAYLLQSKWVYGKQPDGRVAIANTVLMLPFLLYLRGTWHVLRLVSQERPYDELYRDVLIGRRLLKHELPKHVTHVLDLTCEFPASLPRQEGINYLSFPVLDAMAPSVAELADLIKLLREHPTDGVLYVHCANGHGRTGLTAAMIVMSRESTFDAKAAFAQVKERRNGVGLSAPQKQSLQQAAEILRADAQARHEKAIDAT